MADEMLPLYTASNRRPFHVGYGPLTDLPARDGISHGTIKRSGRAPNHSFFTNWTSKDDKVTWKVNVAESDTYKAVIWYTCKKENTGCTMKLTADNGNSVSAKVTKAWDPPLIGKSFDRVVRKSESFVKDFKQLKLGNIQLDKGDGLLTLTASEIPGSSAVDVLAIEIVKAK